MGNKEKYIRKWFQFSNLISFYFSFLSCNSYHEMANYLSMLCSTFLTLERLSIHNELGILFPCNVHLVSVFDWVLNDQVSRTAS